MKLTGKILLSTLVLICSTILAGAILSALPLSPPASLPGTAPSLALMLVSSFVLVIGLVPIASGIRGRYVIRWLAIALMLYLATGVNTAIELTIFGTYGGERYLVVFYFLCFATTAAALARLYGSNSRSHGFRSPLSISYLDCVSPLLCSRSIKPELKDYECRPSASSCAPRCCAACCS